MFTSYVRFVCVLVYNFASKYAGDGHIREKDKCHSVHYMEIYPLVHSLYI